MCLLVSQTPRNSTKVVHISKYLKNKTTLFCPHSVKFKRFHSVKFHRMKGQLKCSWNFKKFICNLFVRQCYPLGILSYQLYLYRVCKKNKTNWTTSCSAGYWIVVQGYTFHRGFKGEAKSVDTASRFLYNDITFCFILSCGKEHWQA